MKKFLIASVFSIFSIVSINAQNEIPKTSASIDAAFGFGKGATSASLSWNRTHGLGQSNKFRLGYGVRFSTFSGSDLLYTTAPAKLAADLTKVDTLTMSKASTMALNALINLQYQFNSKLVVGFNIDAIGVGFGGAKDGIFQSSESKALNGKHESHPTGVNVLLVGNNDIGTLKSEFYLGYKVTDKLGIKAGADLTFSEYTTHVKLTQDNDRFRHKAMLLFLGASYQL